MSTSRTSTTCHCPVCSHDMDAISGNDGVSPKPGDVAVCMYCATPLIIVGDGLGKPDGFRLPNAAEQLCLDTSPMIQRVVAGIRDYHRAHSH